MIIEAPTIPTKQIEDIRKLREPVRFIESFLRFQGEPFKLYPYQTKIAQTVDLLRDRWCLQKARQIGGTLLVAAMLARVAYLTPDATFIVVSKTQEQAGFLFQYAREFLQSSPYLRSIVDRRKSTKHDLRLTNGTVILARTVGNESATNLRGISCKGRGALLLDESAYVSSESTETLLHVAHGAGICHVSTPRRPYGAFHSACNNPSFKVFKVPAYESPRITPDAIQELQRTLRPSQFRTDVLAEFAAGENAVFDADSIDKAIDRSLPLFDAEQFSPDLFPRSENVNYVYALDVARSSAIDRWVLTIGEYHRKNNTLSTVAYAAWSGSNSKAENVITADDPRRIIADVLRFRERFACSRFYIDSTANEFFADHLQNEYLFPVEKVIWSQQRKQLLFEHLATCFRAEKLSIPNDPTIVRQLLDMSYDLKRMEDESERKIYLAGSDDFCDSLAMLGQAVTAETNYEAIDYLEVW